jgi:XTP/dITP diphosphohydrolase
MTIVSTPRLLVVATTNRGKLREIETLLAGLPVRVAAASEISSIVYPDEGDDYEANAIAKARTVASALGEFAVADDSGLEVEALDGRPGARSARYGGPGLDDAGRVARLLAEVEGRPGASRRARFVCWAAFAEPSGATASAVGICAGRLLTAPRGEGGFGYDPVFAPDGSDRSLAEFTAAEKDAISHRGAALRRLLPPIRAAIDAATGPIPR